jgi:uncharacterized membrane protein
MIGTDVLLVLHLLGAVVWVGGMFFALMVLRPALAVLEPAARMGLLLAVLRRFFGIIWIAMPLMLLTGYWMVFAAFGGFADTPWNVDVMMLLGLIMSGVFVWLVVGPWRKFRAAPSPATMDPVRRLVHANLGLGLITVVIAALGQLG